MTIPSTFEAFVYERYQFIELNLTVWGYQIRNGRDISGWDTSIEPLAGYIHITASHGLPEGRLAENVFAAVTEYWIPRTAPGPYHERGFTLGAYSYHFQAGAGDLDRTRFDYHGHRPEMPSHVHERGESQPRFVAPITPEVALAEFEQEFADLLYAGFDPTVREAS